MSVVATVLQPYPALGHSAYATICLKRKILTETSGLLRGANDYKPADPRDYKLAHSKLRGLAIHISSELLAK